jgi:isopentenyl diphosphate isomerase/L-lactate dehydrogenase-like FMN-dependent dehydrogenase
MAIRSRSDFSRQARFNLNWLRWYQVATIHHAERVARESNVLSTQRRTTMIPQTPEDPTDPRHARRLFLSYLANSALLANGASLGALSALLGSLPAAALAQSYDVLRAQTKKNGDIITAPEDALDLMDFEPAAKKALPPAHYGYLATGVDGDLTLRANSADYEKVRIKVKRLVDARKIDTRLKLFGSEYNSPIFLSPISSQGAFHAEAELAVARAAGKKKWHMILSTVGNSAIADVAKAHGSPVWLQLYPTDDWNVTAALIKKAEQAGAPAIMLTVDRQGGRNTETLFRLRRQDNRTCVTCHAGGFVNEVSRKPMFSGVDVSHVTNLYGTGMTWDFVKKLQGATKAKIVLKGIMTPEDAKRAVAAKVDGILVSNHGGRAEESLQSTIGVLPGIVAAVGGRIPVLVDGGVRRGTDVFKALALGATAVGVGRPYCWGLAAFGEPGVAAVLNLLDAEFTTIMRQAGALNLKQIGAASVTHPFA